MAPNKIIQNINKSEEFEEMKKKLEDIQKDCENYKIINNKLLEENSEKQKNIDELNNYYEENQNLNKKIDNLKELLLEKENENKDVNQKYMELEIQLKKYKKEDKNSFKKNANPFKEEFEIEKEKEYRFSMGAKESKAERYKKMVMDYENQIGNDLSQMNMLKSDIKNLKFKLKEKDKILKEIKQLIETGYKGCNPSNKTQKEAIKKLQEYLKNE